MLNDRCDFDDCDGYICEFHSLLPETQAYILQLDIQIDELRKIAMRGINMLDMFADKSRGKYAEECAEVANELANRLKALEADASS